MPPILGAHLLTCNLLAPILYGMRIKNLSFIFGIFAIGSMGCSSALAQDADQAFRLGAFAGAMNYCGDRYDDRQHRYRWARLRVTEEVSSMRRPDRLRALAARDKTLERGSFFGTTLNSQSCKRLLRAGEWQRFLKP